MLASPLCKGVLIFFTASTLCAYQGTGQSQEVSQPSNFVYITDNLPESVSRTKEKKAFFYVPASGYYSIHMYLKALFFAGGEVTYEFYVKEGDSMHLLFSQGNQPVFQNYPSIQELDSHAIQFFRGNRSVLLLIKTKNAIIFYPQARVWIFKTTNEIK